MLKNTRRGRISPGAILLTGFAMRELMDYYNNWRHARRSVEGFFTDQESIEVSNALDQVVEQMMRMDSRI
ncbi:MAG TPA: hypothetical protein VEC36_06800 [Patescibacteria group bacterium]|nr:hypothetical protein [Patescibacteria group bacterium]